MLTFPPARTLRSFALAILSGLVAGFITVLFVKFLTTLTACTHKYQYYYLFLPLALFFVSLGLQAAPKTKGHGATVINAIEANSAIDFLVAPVTFFGSIITIAFGGSAGKVGPAFQTAAALLSKLCDVLKLTPEDRRTLMIFAISG